MKKNKIANKYKIEGMNCDACATMIELDLEDQGIEAICSYSEKTLEIKSTFEHHKVVEIVKKSGYSVTIQNE